MFLLKKEFYGKEIKKVFGLIHTMDMKTIL